MPAYYYRCHDCKKDFEARHGMFFEGQKCIFCYSENIFKLPSLSENKATKKTNKAGKIVDQYIKDAKQELKKEKKSLKIEEL
jgi:putative FmdB family regulatory protein